MPIKVKKEVSFVVTTNLMYEGSFGVSRFQENVETQITIGMHEGWLTGWFEIYDIESGGEEFYGDGGLWFTNGMLVDYDGVFSLSSHVIDGLEKHFGIDVRYFREDL